MARDKLDGIPVTEFYYAICWFVAALSIVLLVVGLWNASLYLSEKGFYGMAFVLSLYATIVVQKNTRDGQMENGNGVSSFKARTEENLTYSESV